MDLGRYLSPRLATGILAAAVILVVAELGRTSGSPGAQSSFVAADAMAASSEVAYAVAAKPAESVGELLVARTWTNVRNARSRRADLEAMLMPGDTVVADSLSKDWYRVALDGEVLGYAHRSTLTVPGTRPGQ